MKEISKSIWESPFEISSWKFHEGLFGSNRSDLFRFIRLETQKYLKEIKPGSRILDLGSGVNDRHYFGRSIDIPDFICLDSSFGMLKCNEAKHKIQADAKILPIDAETIDLCVSIFLMRYLSIDDSALLLQEIQRVLKPNAQFVIIDLEKNSFQQQLSVFDPDLLAEEATKIGFINLVTHSEEKDGIISCNLGGYNTDQHFTYAIGVVSGQKSLS